MKLGYANVDAMLQQMTWTQLEEWLAFSEMEPFDEERSDYRAAQVTAAILNVHRGKQHPALSPKDVVLRFGDFVEQAAKKTWQQMKAIGQMIAMGGG